MAAMRHKRSTLTPAADGWGIWIAAAAVVLFIIMALTPAKADHTNLPYCVGVEKIISDVENGYLNIMHRLADPPAHWRAVGRLEGRAAYLYMEKMSSPYSMLDFDTVVTFDTEGRWYAAVALHDGCYVAHGVRKKWEGKT